MRALLVVALLVACSSTESSPEPDPAGDAAIDDGVPRDGAPNDATSDGAPPDCGDPSAALPPWFRAAPEKEIHVSPSGDDGNDGSSPAKALKTTAAAFKKLAPGVRVNFAAGTYGCAPILGFQGTATRPGWVRSSDGPRKAKLACGGGGGILMDDVHYLALDGLEIEKTSGHGVQLSSGGGPWDPSKISNEVVLHALYIHDTQLASFKASQSKGVYVINNELAYANPVRQNVEIVVVDDVVVAGNEAHHSGYFNEHKGGARRGRIFRNYVHDSTGGILVGGDCTGEEYLVDKTVDFEAKDLVVWGNVIVGGEDCAFRIVDCKDCTVANNTYYANAPKAWMRVLAIGFGGPSGCNAKKLGFANLKVVNNVFLSNKPPTYGIASNALPSSYLEMHHNAWFSTGGDVTKVGSDIPFTGEASSLYVDPKLVSPPSDLHPASGSPVVGKGVAVGNVPAGFEGKCWSGPPNIGAL